MTIRYFKATNDQFTVFRASRSSRAYTGAWIYSPDGLRVRNFAMGFAYRSYPLTAVEIGKAECDALHKAKVARIVAEGKDPRSCSPRDSWVHNHDLT